MLNASCPVEQAADQNTSCFSAARLTASSAISDFKASKGFWSRKNEVSWVIIALKTSRSSDGSVP